MDFRGKCEELGAGEEWLRRVGTRTLAQWYEETDERPSDLAWLAGRLYRHLPPGVWRAVLEALYRAVDRAVREYAPRALEAAGLHEEAARLRALSPVTDSATARAAEAAARAAWAAWAAWAAAVRAAWAARAAEAAALAAEAAAWVAWAAWAAWAAERAAWAAWAAAANAEEERKRQGKELRAALSLPALQRALEAALSRR